jgi:CubicO group peptidase (beta-lactamase class C family)
MKHLFFFFISFSFFAATSFAQLTNLVPNDGMTSPFQKENQGKIIFMDKVIPVETYRQNDSLSAFTLRDAAELDIRVYMGNSLTNFLHALAPSLTADELVQKGNYQFTFYVDGNLLYQENLNKGAGTPDQKNTRTVFRVPLISKTDEDSWGRFLWMRFMLIGGGEYALPEGGHTLKIEIRPYLQLDGFKVGPLIAAGQLRMTVVKPAIDPKQAAIQAIASGSGWQVSGGSFDKVTIEKLNKLVLQKTFKSITSIVIIKNGKLLLEEYFNGANRNTLHDTRSATKSFTSALMGIAIKDGYISNEYQILKEFYDLTQYGHYSHGKDSVKISDLMTMSSAFRGSDDDQDSPGNEEKMYPTADWVKFALGLPMDSTKFNGKQWDYFTAGVVVLGDIMNRSVPGGLEKFADNQLFKPLGITKFQWEYTPQKVVNTAGGLRMSALDYARFGQLYQNGGSWDGRQIIPAKWVAASLSRHLEIPGRVNEFYGYLFWNKTYTANGKNYETWYCAGNGGSKIYIFKDQQLVIVITGTAFNMPYAHSQVDKMMEQYILPAIVK